MAANQNKTLGVSRHVVVHALEDGRFALWNSIFPKITVVDQAALTRLRAGALNPSDWHPVELAALLRARLIFRGPVDPYERRFFDTIERALEELDRDADRFYAERQPYTTLSLVNSGCNLGCSYCVSYFGDDARRDATRQGARDAARRDAILSVVDQFMARKVAYGERTARLALNGGEILLRWRDIEMVLAHVTARYPEIELTVGMNTNATLIDPKIAETLARYRVKVSVSIDGYEANHDTTRHYHGGGGSFKRVIAGINHYEDAGGEKMKGFQGAIEDVEHFDNEAFFAMAERGFSRARLAPNVMDKPAERGAKAARWEAQLVMDSMGRPVEMSSTQFHTVLHRLEHGGVGFRFNCGGLTGMRQRTITFNIDSMQLSQVCSFVSPAATPADRVAYDIYDRSLWTATRAYVKQRMDMLKSACRGCSAFGVCQGGCVYNGLDLYNTKHDSPCNYERAMLRHAVDFSHSGHLQPEDRPAHFLDGSPEGGQGSVASTKKVWTLSAAGA